MKLESADVSAIKVPLIFTASLAHKLPQDLWKAESLINQQPRNLEVDPKNLLLNAVLYLKLGLSTHALGEAHQAQCFVADNDLPLLNLLFRVKADAYLQMCDNKVFHPLSVIVQVMSALVSGSMNEALDTVTAVNSVQETLDFHNESIGAFEGKLEICQKVLDLSLPTFNNPDALLVAIAYKYAMFIIIRASREKVRMKKMLFNRKIMNVANSSRGGSNDPSDILRAIAHYFGRQTATLRRYRSGSGDYRSYDSILSAANQISVGFGSSLSVEVREAPDSSGFKLVARQSIAKGSVFHFEEPIASLWTDYDQGVGCAHCWKPIRGTKVACNGCGEKYCSIACKENARFFGHEVLCGEEWKNFLLLMDLPHCTSAVPSSICLAIKLTVLAVHHGVHPLQLPLFRHLHRRSDLQHCPSSDQDRLLYFSSNSSEMRVPVVIQRFFTTCPSLVKKGVGHAGDVIEMTDTVMTNSAGSGSEGRLHESRIYFLFSFTLALRIHIIT